MITLTTYPEKVLPTGTDYCRWNGAYAPAIWEFIRRDLYYLGLTWSLDVPTSTYYVYLQVDWTANGMVYNSDEVTAMVGNNIRLLNSVNYPGVHKVKSIDYLGITLETIYTVDEVFGYMNSDALRQSYFVEIQLYSKLGAVYTLIDENIRLRADQNGLVKFNAGAWLKNYLLSKSTFDYTTSERDLALGGAYTIKYRESYINSSSVFSSYSKTCYYLGASPELRSSNNMLEYFMGKGKQGKFLSGFVEPTWFKDFPFELDWIYDDLMENTEIFRVCQDYFNNTDAYSDEIDESQFGGVFAMRCKDAAWKKMNVFLNSGDPIDEGVYVERSYVESQYVR